MRRPGRLALAGYTAVQEASYWALALAPGLDLWGVDRQLRATDFRQRVFFAQRRADAQPHKFVFVAPDPALAYGEPNEPGMKILESCDFSLDSDKLLYLTGDAHHYERQAVGDSMHVIAGGGGAFVHGTRIASGFERRSSSMCLSRSEDQSSVGLGDAVATRRRDGRLPAPRRVRPARCP